MMSSSPKLAPVEMFQYPEPGKSEASPNQGSAENRASAPSGTTGRETPEQLELKLAAARAERIREGLQQAQASLEKQLSIERAKIAETIYSFSQKTNEYYSRAENELVHLALAIAAKILHREAQVDRMLVAALVKVAIDKLQQGTRVTVHVRPEQVTPWIQYFQEKMVGRIQIGRASCR